MLHATCKLFHAEIDSLDIAEIDLNFKVISSHPIPAIANLTIESYEKYPVNLFGQLRDLLARTYLNKDLLESTIFFSQRARACAFARRNSQPELISPYPLDLYLSSRGP